MSFIGSLILVASGYRYPYNGLVQDYSQVVDMKSINSCPNLNSYPLKMLGATGGLVNGSPVICGGWGRASGEPIVHGSTKVQSSCYSFDTPSQAWKHLAEMKRKRKHSSSVVTNEGLWVTGGVGLADACCGVIAHISLATTEYIYKNGAVIYGPDLPSARVGHCMVTLPDGNILIMGGHDRSILIFNPEDKSFSQGPSLIHDRRSAACTIFSSAMHGERPVVLSTGGNGQSTAEILDFSNPNVNTWEASKHIYPD